MCDDKELNQWASLKKSIQYRYMLVFAVKYLLRMILFCDWFSGRDVMTVCRSFCWNSISIYSLSLSWWSNEPIKKHDGLMFVCLEHFIFALFATHQISWYSLYFIRTKEEEKKDIKRYRQRGRDLNKKMLILKSLANPEYVYLIIAFPMVNVRILTVQTYDLCSVNYSLSRSCQILHLVV